MSKSNRGFFHNVFRKNLVQDIIKEISQGEISTVIGIPGMGKSNTIHWLKSNTSKKDTNIFFVSVDLNELTTGENIEFYRLILLNIYDRAREILTDQKLATSIAEEYEKYISCNDTLLTFTAFKNIIKRLITETDLQICICLIDFELIKKLSTSICNAFSTIRNVNKSRISYLFFVDHPIEQVFSTKEAGGLYDFINYNKKWLLPLNKEETFLLIDEFCQVFDSKLTSSQKDRIWELSGGHSWYIKVLTKFFSENKINNDTQVEKIASMPTISAKGTQIWTHIPKDDKKSIIQALRNKSTKNLDFSEYIENTGLITIKGNSLSIFSPLIKHFIQERAEKYLNGHNGITAEDKLEKISSSRTNRPNAEKQSLMIDIKRRAVVRDGKILQVQFSKAEFDLLKYFFENSTLSVTRDEVASILWKKDVITKYSDWAIDKIISRIRKKIEIDPKKPKYLLTLRGVGFKFLTT
ncbi:MAG: winged helix-turn-helix domain-containing protein [Candidatus Dojkabacteria bacterium]|nr:winged helix-turn-helix domain-containing protein [Candidatus Dojkabacteria bacterium]